MSNQSNSNDFSPKKTDPRLKSFLRKAAAIISAERGLNATSRLKLQTLADRESLPRPLFTEALERLQSDETLSNLTHYEKSFLKFLKSEFEKLAGDVLSPGAEKKAISHAERKYQINGTRAEQLIDVQSERSGIGRISPKEGRAFANAFIVEKIGGLPSIDEEIQEEIYLVGKKWGVTQRDVDELIASQIKQSRSSKGSGHVSKLAAVVLFLFSIAAIVFAGYQFNWFDSGRKVAPLDSPIPGETGESEAGLSWLNASTQQSLANLTQTSGPWNQSLELIKDTQATQQRLGIRRLSQFCCVSDSEQVQSVTQILGEIYLQIPDDESARVVIQTLESHLDFSPEKSVTLKDIKDSYRANTVVGEMLILSAPTAAQPGRKDAIRTLAASISNANNSNDPNFTLRDYQNISESELAANQWNHLIQRSWTGTPDIARLVQPLTEITKQVLDPNDLERFHDDTLFNILSANIDRWKELEHSIIRSMESCEPQTLTRWLNVFANSSGSGFQELVGKTLADRLNLKPRSSRIADITDKVAEHALGVKFKQFQPALDRSELVEKLIAEIADKPMITSGLVSPDRIAQVALAINVELAFWSAIEESSGMDDSTFSEFDRLIALPSPRLRELVSLPIDRKQSESIEQSTAMASDQRRKDAALSRLQDTNADTSGLRALAFNQLERVAHRFKTISYQDAKVLAKYLLSSKTIDERLNIENKLESFSHWPNLALAISDLLTTHPLERDRVLGLVRILMGREFDNIDSGNWQQTLRVQVIASVASDIREHVDHDPSNIHSNWARLKIYLNDIYRERISISPYKNTYTASTNPAETAIELVLNYAEYLPPAEQYKFERAAALIAAQSNNEVTRTALAEQLIVQLIGFQLKETIYEKEANAILAKLEDLDASSQQESLAGNRLYRSEFMLMKMLDLKRQFLIQQMRKGVGQ